MNDAIKFPAKERPDDISDGAWLSQEFDRVNAKEHLNDLDLIYLATLIAAWHTTGYETF